MRQSFTPETATGGSGSTPTTSGRRGSRPSKKAICRQKLTHYIILAIARLEA